MKAMIFAAGLGTRLKPLTNNKPKALVEIEGKTLLERSITYLKHYGINDMTVNVHHYAQQIRNFLEQHDHFGIAMHISDETGMLLNTGGGILKARTFLEGKEPVLLINVDILTNLDLDLLLQFHKESEALASLAVSDRETSRYLLFDRMNQLCGWKNTTTGELRIARPDSVAESFPMAFSGIHLIEPELLSLIRESGKFSVIDLYLRLAATEKILAFAHPASGWMDLGKYEQMDSARQLIKQMDSEQQ